MKIGLCHIMLHVPNSHSLKEKRAVIKRVMEKIRAKYNVALLQLDSDSWQIANIAITTLEKEAGRIHSSFSHILSFLETQPDVQLLEYKIEVL